MNSSKLSITTLCTTSQLTEIETLWQQLTTSIPHSYFLSWGWVETWLESLPPSIAIECHFGLINNIPCFGFFTTRTILNKRKLFYYRCENINTTGNEVYDDLVIEYNNFLINTDLIDNKLAIKTILDSFKTDKIIINACNDSTFHTLQNTPSDYELINNTRESFYIDLANINNQKIKYIDTLSKNTRYQINKSFKQYSKEGDINLEIAGTTDKALSMLNELIVLHQNYWINKSKEGSFSTDFFNTFHKKLITNRFQFNEILIAKISTQKHVIGYLYGFTHNGIFLYYQSGFNYSKSDKLKPGYVSHYMLINHLIEKGFDTYDFLAGNQQYKKSLSSDQTKMHWVTLNNNKNITYKIEKFLKKIMTLS